MSLEEAVAYQPQKPTYALRIFPSLFQLEVREFPLQNSYFYIRVAEYVFDDNETEPFKMESGAAWIDENIAQMILDDFSQHRERIETLLVHCSGGKNRAPAVALALNESFNLGHDSKQLQQQYPEFNRHTHETLKRAFCHR